MGSLFQELKRRNVFRVGAAYLVAAWLAIQLVETILPAFGFGDGAVRLVVLVLAIGFVPVLILAWAFELTPDGVKRDAEVDHSQPAAALGRRQLNRALVALLALALGYFALDRFVLEPQGLERAVETEGAPATSPAPAAPVTAATRSVAVLPFVAMSRGEDDGYFADGLTEEILNSLASLPELQVTARTSAFHFKDTNLPIPEIAAALGVANVVEGSVRRDGDRVRITAQLIRAADGFHLWSDTYDHTLQDVFAVQEDIAQNIAEVLDVVLDDGALARMRDAGIGDVEAFIAYQKAVEAFNAAHSDISNVSGALAQANRGFDEVLAKAPHLTTARLLRADLKGHLVFEIASGYRPEAYPGEAAEALAGLRDDYARAWDNARPGTERSIVEVERILFSDDWTGLAARLDEALASEDCVGGNWLNQLGDPYGRAETAARRMRQYLQCDPLSGVGVLSLVQAEIWSGRPQQALEALDEAEARQVRVPFFRDLRVSSTVAAGQATAEGLAFTEDAGSLYPFGYELLREAAAGNTARARELYEAYRARPGVDDYSSIVAAAIVGDRAAANAAAARIDARPGGPFTLTVALEMCLCGAAFDLDATPNFRARLEEAGWPWPPGKPIDYPLKDW